LASVLFIGICQERAPAPGNWRELWNHLYYVPIVAAALYDGWRTGLLIAAFSIISLFQPVFRYGFTVSAVFRAEYVDPLLFCAIALLIGRYTDRARQEKHNHQLVSEQLANVYEKLQTNFDGMKRAERLSAIGQLSAGLAHEIRNPLASIAGAASILRKAGPLDAKASKCVDIIVSECKRLNGLLTTFLNFARPRPPQLQRVSVNGILDGVIALAQHAIGQKNIAFHRDVAGKMPLIECDPEQMTQVLLNLIINATEASDAGSVVTLAADQTGHTVRIRVIDQGSGVPPEDIDKLFNPFFTTKESGTGLGLPVAHQIVGQMGGILTAQRNPFGGMTFSIDFPKKDARKET
jgi:signal transduction histidine kinase